MSKRTLGDLSLLGGQFAGEGVTNPSDEGVFWTLESVGKETLDIQLLP